MLLIKLFYSRKVQFVMMPKLKSKNNIYLMSLLSISHYLIEKLL